MRIKKLATILMVLLMMLGTAIPVAANDQDNVLGQIIWEMEQQMEVLRHRIAELEARPETPATPDPIYAPHPRLLSPQNITIEPGETRDITVTLRNIGTHSAFNLLTQASTEGPFTVEFTGNSNNITSIAENRDANMTMRIIANENATPGVYTITLSHFFRNQARLNMPTITDTITVRVGGAPAGTPNVRLGSFALGEFMTVAAPIGRNDNFVVTANLQNMGTATARDVQVSLPNQDANTVFFTGDLNQAFVPELTAGFSQALSFQFRTSSSIDSGTFPIDFAVTFRDENGQNPQTETFQFFVNVHVPEDATRPALEIRSMAAPTGRINVGQQANISFYLHNSGDAVAYDIRVEATPESGAVVPMGTSRFQNVGTIRPGQSVQLTFGFSPTDAAQTRSYAVGFNVQFEERRGDETNTRSLEQHAAINVYNPEDEEDDNDNDDDHGRIQIPRIIVSNYSVYPRIPLAGHTFDMEITFRNTNTTRSINNVRIVFEALEAVQNQGTVFTPHDGSNSMFIDYIPPGGEVTRSISWFTVPDASPRSYPMRVRFEYQDQEYREFTAEENLNINVAQVVRLQIEEPSIPSSVSVGGSIWFDLQIINSGMVPLRNLRVRVDGPFEASRRSFFMGNINPGAFRTYTDTIMPIEEGMLDGRIVVYGEDATGATVEFYTEFTVEVTGGFGGMGGDFGGDFEMGIFDREHGMFEGGGMIWEGDEGMGWPEEDDSEGLDIMELLRRPWVWAILAGIPLLIIVIVIIVVRRKNRLKFDDED